HGVQAGGHDPERPAGEHRTLVVQARHEHFHTAAFLAENVLRRYFTIAEDQLTGVRTAHPELVQLLRRRETFHAFLDDEGGDGFGGLAVDHEYTRVRSIGDPHLVAVQQVAIAPPLCAQPHADDVRAGAGL